MVPGCFASWILINYRSTCVGREPARSLAPIGTHINHSTHTTGEGGGGGRQNARRGRRLLAVDNRYHRRPGIRISRTVSRISSRYRFSAPPTKSGRQKKRARRQRDTFGGLISRRVWMARTSAERLIELINFRAKRECEQSSPCSKANAIWERGF